ncbi:class I SAM-dependent methyltransferase [Methylovirgula sp. HY1]|uniref:class I SAM-dependent methyltransferase n=1 Tax=Methylovirgula sp. HY1 TaxID=2822761 RepID=UPI001C5BB800|nr:class I SAM-dependent methyltransferase [Methylovirgula sp. HY1]
MAKKSATAFFDTWQTYRKVVAANYMYHVEIQADIERLLRARFGAGKVSFLDLGCGDAATLAPLLGGVTVQRYKGVDLSEAALALAAENLKFLSCPVDLTCRDILAALEAETELYDVVYTSFALHHLSTEQKAAFFRLVAQRLAKDGVLVLTDVVREDDESLPVYLTHYCDWLRRDWDGLDTDEKAAICDHIENNDRPETLTELQSLAAAAGLADAAAVSGYGWHRVLRFQRAGETVSRDAGTHA